MSKLSKVLAYLNKPVSEVVGDVVQVAKGVAAAVVTAVAGVAASVASSPVAAQTSAYVTDAQAGITQAKSDALTVGGYVIAAIAVLIAIGWVLSMLKKR